MHAHIRERASSSRSVEIGSLFGTDTGAEPREERSSSKEQYVSCSVYWTFEVYVRGLLYRCIIKIYFHECLSNLGKSLNPYCFLHDRSSCPVTQRDSL